MSKDTGLGYPIWGCPFTLVFPIRDRYGVLQTGCAASADSEISKDGAAFTDCTNEIAEIGSSGYYKITLEAAETQAAQVVYKVTASGCVFSCTLLPVRCAVVLDGQATAGGANTLTLAAGTIFTDDEYNGYILLLDGGTGAGQASRVIDSVGATRILTVQTNWDTQPDNSTTYQVLMPPERSAMAEDAVREIRYRSCMGVVTDTGDGTIKVYDGPDPAGANVLFTLTKTTVGDQDTWVRS